jgi:hypothetical protein
MDATKASLEKEKEKEKKGNDMTDLVQQSTVTADVCLRGDMAPAKFD